MTGQSTRTWSESAGSGPICAVVLSEPQVRRSPHHGSHDSMTGRPGEIEKCFPLVGRADSAARSHAWPEVAPHNVTILGSTSFRLPPDI
jgi:hypothetical protein